MSNIILHCEDCQTMIKEYGRNSLNDCELCGHLYPINFGEGECSCKENKEVLK